MLSCKSLLEFLEKACLMAIISWVTCLAAPSLRTGMPPMHGVWLEKPIALHLRAGAVEGLKKTCERGTKHVWIVCLALALNAWRTNRIELAGFAWDFPHMFSWAWVPPWRKNKMHSSSQVNPWVPTLARAHFLDIRVCRICFDPLSNAAKVSGACACTCKVAALLMSP